MLPAFKSKLLLSILLPVFGVGVIISILAIYYLTPPLFEFIENRIDSELSLATGLALQLCEKDANYLFELRLEDDAEMNAASKNQSLEEVLKVSQKFHNLQILVIEDNTKIVGSTEQLRTDQISIGPLKKKTGPVIEEELWTNPVRMHSRYFPFWNWHIVSYIHARVTIVNLSGWPKTSFIWAPSVSCGLSGWRCWA